MANSEQTPLAAFPDNIIAVPKISAPTEAQLQLILEYNQYVAAGNLTAANAIISANPDLNNCRMTTDDYNTIIDEIKAIEIFFNDQVQDFIDTAEARAAQAPMGLDDTTISDQTTYTSTKMERTFYIDIQPNQWSETRPGVWQATVASSDYADDDEDHAGTKAGLSRISSGMSPVIAIRYPATDESTPVDKSRKRMLDKAFSVVYLAQTGTESITFTACENPNGPIYLRVKGV